MVTPLARMLSMKSRMLSRAPMFSLVSSSPRGLSTSPPFSIESAANGMSLVTTRSPYDLIPPYNMVHYGSAGPYFDE